MAEKRIFTNRVALCIYNLFVYIYYCMFSFFVCFYFLKTYVEPILHEPPTNPCLPSPCGPNSQCRAVGSTPACSCIENFIGRAPNCRPECTINAECSANLACINKRCRDPCPGSCGFSAICNVVNHSPVCTCQIGYTGDPFSGCIPVPSKDYYRF